MLNNRVRFGNMKRVNRAVWALTVILMMVLGLVLAGCSGDNARFFAHFRIPGLT